MNQKEEEKNKIDFLIGPVNLVELYNSKTKQHVYVFGEIHNLKATCSIAYSQRKQTQTETELLIELFNQQSKETPIHFFFEIQYVYKKSNFLPYVKPNDLLKYFQPYFIADKKTGKKKQPPANVFFHAIDIRQMYADVPEFCVEDLQKKFSFLEEYDRVILCHLLIKLFQNITSTLDVTDFDDVHAGTAAERYRKELLPVLQTRWSQFPESRDHATDFLNMFRGRLRNKLNQGVVVVPFSQATPEKNLTRNIPITSMRIEVIAFSSVLGSETERKYFVLDFDLNDINKSRASEDENNLLEFVHDKLDCVTAGGSTGHDTVLLTITCFLKEKIDQKKEFVKWFYPRKLFLTMPADWKVNQRYPNQIQLTIQWKIKRDSVACWWLFEPGDPNENDYSQQLFSPLAEYLTATNRQPIFDLLLQIFKIKKQFSTTDTKVEKAVIDFFTRNEDKTESLLENAFLNKKKFEELISLLNFFHTADPLQPHKATLYTGYRIKIIELLKLALYSFSLFVDLYTLGRLFRQFSVVQLPKEQFSLFSYSPAFISKQPIQKAIIHAGNSHAQNYINFLKSYGFEEIASSQDFEHGCLPFSKFRQPLFTV